MRNVYYLALSSAAAAAVVMAPETAAAVCDCTLRDVAPTKIGTLGPEVFVYRGSTTSGYDAQLSQDSHYGFTGVSKPQVWFDYEQTATGAGFVTSATLCRLSYTGASIVCAPTADQTVTGPANSEMAVPVTGTWGTTAPNSAWDLIRMRVVSPWSSFKPRTIPWRYSACW